LCPVSAYIAWISLAGLADGPVFRAIDRCGHVSADALHINSLIPLLRSLFEDGGVARVQLYCGHSLPRGFGNWTTVNGWDFKTLMESVGWKNVRSAMRYVEGATRSLDSASSAHCVPPCSPLRTSDLAPMAEFFTPFLYRERYRSCCSEAW